MMFVTYNAESGELIGVTSEPPPADVTTCTRAVSTDSVELATWDAKFRAFREELHGEQSWRITRLAFRNRFTPDEKASMEFAALDNPSATLAARRGAATLRSYMADVAASTFVDLSREDTRKGVIALESLGLLAAGRANEILNTVPEGHELYIGV